MQPREKYATLRKRYLHVGRIVNATTARNPHDYIDEHRGGNATRCNYVIGRWSYMHPVVAVMEALVSNIPAAPAEFREPGSWLLAAYTTSFSCHDKCQWARRNPFFLSRQLQRAAARPRPRVSGFTWDIPVLWQEIIACEYMCIGIDRAHRQLRAS